ncbi:hypothetical protein ACHAXR_002092 [Thalassiosira sp. AJA248-18]
MATRGVSQLKKLRIRYCEFGGSSAVVRDYLQQSPHLLNFANDNPQISIIVKPRNGHHPYIQGEYVTGQSKQMCVKNTTEGRVREVMDMLRNTSGRKIVRLGGLAVRGDCPSIQGVWTPMLNFGEKKFDINIVGES